MGARGPEGLRVGTSVVSVPIVSMSAHARRLLRAVALAVVAAAAMLVVLTASAWAQEPRDAADSPSSCEPADAACPVDETPLPAANAAANTASASSAVLMFFWGVGCPHCEEAKPFVDALEKEEPRLRVERLEVRQDPEGRRRFLETMRRLAAAGAGVPTFVVGDAYVVGYVKGETDQEVRTVVRRALSHEDADAGQAATPRVIRVPLIGTVDPASVPLPALTLTMGLVDGVNPCAMWVLLFLLSFLVNLKSRPKMLLIAGTFVTISGLAYFAFMAAWLNVFLLIGLSRIVQVALGLVALFVGGVHVKDYFAFKKGISFSIPEAAKPTIYARMRAVVHAEHMLLALASAAVLAVMVNVIELLCTAGLPALYTQVLAAQGFPAWKRYAYLALYNTAYMFDDSIMVTVAVVTLSRRKLQEKGGRQLKLVSGATMLALGLLLILKPQWLL